jgi:anti-anti-sigma regulatory factor
MEGHPVGSSTLEVRTDGDGSVVVRPSGVIGLEDAVELRQILVRAVRRMRPLRLVVDLADVSGLDPINLGTLAAACTLGDDHQVIVFVDNSSAAIAADLTAAGVPHHRLRRITAPGSGRGR